jgi:hypothetical protein
MPQMHFEEALINYLLASFALPTLVMIGMAVLIAMALKLRRGEI